MDTKLENAQKAALIVNLHLASHDNSIQSLVKLLDMEVLNSRRENDDAGIDKVRINQGKIAAYKQILQWIEHGLPSTMALK